MPFGGIGRLSIGALIVLAEESDFALGYCFAGLDRPRGLAACVGWACDRNARNDREDNASVMAPQGEELEKLPAARVVIS